MDKHNFKKIALMGLAGGMLLAAQAPVAAHVAVETETTVAGCGGAGSCSGSQRPRGSSCSASRGTSGEKRPNRSFIAEGETTQTRTLTESELLSKLNAEGKAVYQGLSPEGKALVMRMVNESCKGGSACNGYKDVNELVKSAARKMAEKRANMSGNRTYNTPSYDSRPTSYEQY